MGANHHLDFDPTIYDVMCDLSDWVNVSSDWHGPPEDFRARDFVEGMIQLWEEDKPITPRQEEALIELYNAFDVEESMHQVRAFHRAISKDD